MAEFTKITLNGNISAFDDSEDHIRPSQALESYFRPIFISQNCEGQNWLRRASESS